MHIELQEKIKVLKAYNKKLRKEVIKLQIIVEELKNGKKNRS